MAIRTEWGMLRCEDCGKLISGEIGIGWPREAFKRVRHFALCSMRLWNRKIDPGVRVYEMNDCDWYIARSPVQALLKAMHDTGLTRSEVLGDGMAEPREIREEELDRLKYYDEATEQHMTFRRALERWINNGEPVPAIFACSEY